MYNDRQGGSRTTRRERLPWPQDKTFKILSLDGGGIRGIYGATILSRIEKDITNGESVADYFDLIAGTSTGGIIALGLGAGKSAKSIYDLYCSDGNTIFPRGKIILGKRIECRFCRWVKHWCTTLYSSRKIEVTLQEQLGEKRLGDSDVRLIITSFNYDYKNNRPNIAALKTDHHKNYENDYKEEMWKIARSTSAAPTYIPGYEWDGAQ